MKFPFLPQPFYRESLFPRRRYIPRRTELRIPPFHGYNEHRESSYVHTITLPVCSRCLVGEQAPLRVENVLLPFP